MMRLGADEAVFLDLADLDRQFRARPHGVEAGRATTLEELAKEYDGKLKIAKMNVDDNPQVPSQYGVRSIPNLVLFKNGQVKDQIVGAVPKQTFVTAIDKVVV